MPPKAENKICPPPPLTLPWDPMGAEIGKLYLVSVKGHNVMLNWIADRCR